MMKLRKPILFGLAAVAGYYLLKVANVANVATKARFVLRGISFHGLNLVARIGVLNPTSSQLNFSSFVGDVFLGDKVVATAQSFTPVAVMANSQQDVNITFVPNTFGIVEVLTDALNKSVNTKVTIVGTANINNLTIPVKLVW